MKSVLKSKALQKVDKFYENDPFNFAIYTLEDTVLVFVIAKLGTLLLQ